MFQPQTTPYSPFASYGAVPDFHLIQKSQTGRFSLGVGSGGLTSVRNPIFSTHDGNANSNNASVLTYNDNNSIPQFKTAANNMNDLEQQEELARGFQPDLQVWGMFCEVRYDQC